MAPDLILFLLVIVIILMAATIFGVLVYSGLFTFPEVRTSSPPINYTNCTFAYRFLRGAYSSNDVGAAFTLATAIAPKAIAVGIYYDDPKRVPENELRCAVGCLIQWETVVTDDDKTEKTATSTGDVVTRSFIDEREENLLKKKGFHFVHLPAVELAVVSEFPYTTPFSIWLAPSRVYPRLSDYICSKRLCAYPFLEIYSDNRIRYMAPLSKQDGFFVPETEGAVEDQEHQHQQDDNAEDSAQIQQIGSREEPAAVGTIQTCIVDDPNTTVTMTTSAGDDESTTNIRQRKNVPVQPSSSTDTRNNAEEICPRKDSSSSSSFEELGVEELKE